MILHFLLLADVFTVATACVVCTAAGWVLGYAHRSLIGWGIRRNPLRRAVRAYREAWKDIVHLWTTWQLRPRRLARRDRPGH